MVGVPASATAGGRAAERLHRPQRTNGTFYSRAGSARSLISHAFVSHLGLGVLRLTRRRPDLDRELATALPGKKRPSVSGSLPRAEFIDPGNKQIGRRFAIPRRGSEDT